MRRAIIFAVMMLVLTSCAPDPRKQADANATNSAANQRAANETQARAQDAEEHELKMQNRRAYQAEWQNLINNAITFSSYFVRATLMMWILGVGVFGVLAMRETTRAYSKYAQRRAIILANQIKLDPSTHTFPLLTVEVGKNIIALVNPNDDSVLFVDKSNPANTAKVQAMANVLFAGELGRHARLSHKPGEVAGIPATQIIDSEVKS